MGTTIAGWFNHLDDTSQVDNGWCKNHPNKNTVFHHIKEVDWLSCCSLLMVLIYPIIYCMTIYYICIYRIIDPQLHPKQWQKAIITKEVSCLVPSTLPRYPFSAAKKNCRSRRSRLPKQGRLSHAGLDVSSKSTTALRFQKGNIMLKLET